MTIPDIIGTFDPTGSTVVFEIVVDDYAEVWVNGQLPRLLGQVGGPLIKGFNAPNRVMVGRDVKPGQQFQLAVFGINGPLSDPPGNFIWIRSATLDFYKPNEIGNVQTFPAAVTRMGPALDDIDTFFRRHRRRKWNPMRLTTHGHKRTRMDVRVRHTSGSLRYVGKGALVCSELRNRPDGRRTYLACNDLRATARQMVMGYRLRWAVEFFHTSVKQNLGFEDVATHGFDAVISPVHWVYSAYILLHMSPPGLSPGVQRIGDKQRALQQGLADKEKRHILQQLTHIGGVQHYKAALRQALTGT